MAQAMEARSHATAQVNRIELDRPWTWLAKGWEDFRSNPVIGVCYGVLAALTGYLITLGLWAWDVLYLILPLTAGFLIVGPLLTVGLYEVSRRRELGEATVVGQALAAYRQNGSQIALMGVLLLLVMFFWARLAALLFMLYFGFDPPSFADLFQQTFLRADALPFLIIGTVAGALMAFLTFALTVVAIPMLLDRADTNVVEAAATSFRAVQANPGPLIFWAALIAVFTIAGLVTLYLGLIVTLPLVGHASWHAYRDLVSYDK